MKKMLLSAATLALLLAPLSGLRADSGSWNGWITDEACGAHGAKADHVACAKKCAAKGSALVFYNDADKKIYKIDKQDLAKDNLGHEVKVEGDLKGDSIAVASISAAAPSK